MKYYVISDVHACYMAMLNALQEKGFFDDPVPHKLICLGDLIDQGRDLYWIQEFFSEEIDRGEVILIRGNHEDLLQDLMDNIEQYVAIKPRIRCNHWRNGTIQTLAELAGMQDVESVYADPIRARTLGEESVFCKKIMPAMIDYYETEHYVFVHGFIPVYKKGLAFDPKWIQYREDWRDADESTWSEAREYNNMLYHHLGIREPGKTIVAGHTEASFGHSRYEGKGDPYGRKGDHSPYLADGLVSLDSCAALTGFLNCIVLEDQPLKEEPPCIDLRDDWED